MIVYSGRALRRVREDAGVSREMLAVLIGRTESAVRKYETGLLTPSARVLGRLAGALACNVGELFVPADGATDAAA